MRRTRVSQMNEAKEVRVMEEHSVPRFDDELRAIMMTIDVRGIVYCWKD